MPRQPRKYAWFAPQFMSFKKAPSWYTTIAIAGILVALFFIFFLHRYLAAVVTILGVIVLFRYSRTEPQKNKITINNKGIKVGSRFYLYEELVGFYFAPTNDGIYLYLKSNKRLSFNTPVLIENKDPNEIRATLAPHLPELPSQGEELIDKVSRVLRF